MGRDLLRDLGMGLEMGLEMEMDLVELVDLTVEVVDLVEAVG